MIDFQRNLTNYDFFKALTNKAMIGYHDLSANVRYAQAQWAQRCRNFFFTASVPVPVAVPAGSTFPGKLVGSTPRFSDPIIIMDALSMVDKGVGGTNGLSPQLEIFDYGRERAAYGDDFYGLSGPIPQEYLLKHERNVEPGQQADRPAKWLGFVPRLIRPYQTLRLEYSQVPKNYPQLQVGFRGLRVLPESNPYSDVSESASKRLRAYIEASEPVSFYTDVSAPMILVRNSTNAAGAGVPLVRRTNAMDRPLLILGCTSNVEGVQASLIDESNQYRFDWPDTPLNITQKITPPYKSVPLCLWAPDSDFHNPEMVNLFPVPHFLAPGAVLRVEFSNGLMPDATGFQQQTSTRGEEDVRVTFICRTP